MRNEAFVGILLGLALSTGCSNASTPGGNASGGDETMTAEPAEAPEAAESDNAGATEQGNPSAMTTQNNRPQPAGAPEAPADVAAAPANAETTDSGLASRVLEAGSGTAHPSARDRVTVHYSGWTTDGQMFDSSVARGRPATFPLNGVIAGWTEGLQLMVEGEKRRFWIPANLAYGENPRPGAPRGMLVFDVELLSIQAVPPPPEVPSDVAAAPADAETTESGLASKVISAGTGTAHPAATDTVRVHYSGWTTDGRMFDSSVARGEPTTFPLNRVIAGWTEGLQLMVTGEKRRFWIPANLAYGDNPRPGAPRGTLVFDVELLEINP